MSGRSTKHIQNKKIYKTDFKCSSKKQNTVLQGKVTTNLPTNVISVRAILILATY